MKKFFIHTLITIMFLVLSLLPGICPESWQRYLSYAAIPMIFAVLDGILCGGGYGALLGLMMPLISKLLFGGEEFLPHILLRTLTLAVMGFSSGAFYGYTYQLPWTLLGAGLLGLTSYGVFGVVIHWVLGLSFSIKDFFEETILAIGPGILLTVLVALVLISLLRKTGGMTVLRDERIKRKKHVVG